MFCFKFFLLFIICLNYIYLLIVINCGSNYIRNIELLNILKGCLKRFFFNQFVLRLPTDGGGGGVGAETFNNILNNQVALQQTTPPITSNRELMSNRPSIIQSRSLSTESSCKSCSSSDSDSEVFNHFNSRRCECGSFHNDSVDDGHGVVGGVMSEVSHNGNIDEAGDSNEENTYVNIQQQCRRPDNLHRIRNNNDERVCDIFETNLYLDRIFVNMFNF